MGGQLRQQPNKGVVNIHLQRATEWGKRYGKNLAPKVFDDAESQWYLAKDENWGAWSCCNGAASLLGCQWREEVPKASHAKPLLEERHIKFLTHGNVCKVAGEEEKCWRLDSGRVAKKKTEGKVWVWVSDKSSQVKD